MGVAQGTYDRSRASQDLPAQSVRHITRAEVEAIHWQWY